MTKLVIFGYLFSFMIISKVQFFDDGEILYGIELNFGNIIQIGATLLSNVKSPQNFNRNGLYFRFYFE